MDLVLLHAPSHYDSLTLKEELIQVLKLRDSEIKFRGGDLNEKWTYVSRRYPTLRAADCNHELAYKIRIILADEKPESCHILKHQEMMQGLIEKGGESLK